VRGEEAGEMGWGLAAGSGFPGEGLGVETAEVRGSLGWIG